MFHFNSLAARSLRCVVDAIRVVSRGQQRYWGFALTARSLRCVVGIIRVVPPWHEWFPVTWMVLRIHSLTHRQHIDCLQYQRDLCYRARSNLTSTTDKLVQVAAPWLYTSVTDITIHDSDAPTSHELVFSSIRTLWPEQVDVKGVEGRSFSQ